MSSNKHRCHLSKAGQSEVDAKVGCVKDQGLEAYRSLSQQVPKNRGHFARRVLGAAVFYKRRGLPKLQSPGFLRMVHSQTQQDMVGPSVGPVRKMCVCVLGCATCRRKPVMMFQGLCFKPLAALRAHSTGVSIVGGCNCEAGCGNGFAEQALMAREPKRIV